MIRACHDNRVMFLEMFLATLCVANDNDGVHHFELTVTKIVVDSCGAASCLSGRFDIK